MFDAGVIYGHSPNLTGERLGVMISDRFHTAIRGSSGENAEKIIRTCLPVIDCGALTELTGQIRFDIQCYALPEWLRQNS